MHTTSLLTTLLLAAIPTLAARPSIDFYSTSNCASGSGPTGSFGPIPTDVCQDLTGFHTGPAFGAKVTGPYPAGCTCESYPIPPYTTLAVQFSSLLGIWGV